MGGKQDQISEQPSNIVHARHLVEHLSDALREGELGLKTVPGLMRAVLVEGAWKERQLRNQKVVKFERFIDFITSKPLDGLGEQPEMIKRLLNNDPETLAMFEEAMVGPRGGDRKSENAIKGSNPTVDRGKAYTLRRLSKERPDLMDEVKAGTLSANAAAVKAGFRRAPAAFDVFKRVWAKATQAERLEIISWIGNNG